MAYSRQPNVTIAGRGLTQNPAPVPPAPAGIIQVGYDANIASTTTLGIVQVGSGLSITPSGILSATGSGSDLVQVTLVSSNYTALASDYFIVVTARPTVVTLPLGVTGKVYIIKNKSSGNITVNTSGGQTIDTSSSKSLGSESSLYVIFDGTRWNTIT